MAKQNLKMKQRKEEIVFLKRLLTFIVLILPFAGLPALAQSDTLGQFQIQSLHEIELGEERDSAIQKLLAQGFSRGQPPKAYNFDELARAENGGRYLLERDSHSHDHFPYGEQHVFVRENLEVRFQTMPTGPKGKVMVLKRTEEIAEPIHLQAAYDSVAERASVEPSCAEKRVSVDIGYQIDSGWNMLDIPRGGVMCGSELWLSGSYSLANYGEDLREKKIGSKKFDVSFYRGPRVPQGMVSEVRMTTTDIEGSLNVLSVLKAKSDAALKAEASQQGLSDF